MIGFEQQKQIAVNKHLVPNDFPDPPKASQFNLHLPDGRQQYTEAVDQWWYQVRQSLLQKLQDITAKK